MCGFVGWINQDLKKPIDFSILKAMNQTLYHRGPDDEGYFVEGNIGIAHRRLSIIDISGHGRQPIFNEDRTVLVVLNGEIYNYLKLKEELTNEGHVFYTSTDTEVIVHSYEKWGADFLKKLDGMFSLALYDMQKKILILARDPFGKKPLYYTLQNGVFLFASEIKAFSPNPHFKKILNMSSVSKYLAYEYVPTPHSIFKDCQKLPRASFVTVNTRNITAFPAPQRYWELSYEPKLKISEQDAISELIELMTQAIQKRLISDVPLGVFLSGGLDSSTIVALLSKSLPARRIKTFNIGFYEKTFDESSYARLVAQHFGTDHYEDMLQPKTMIDVFPDIIDKMDEPLADPSIIPTYLLCRFAKGHITVALGGDGGDELLAGYDPFLAHKLSPLVEILPLRLIEALRRSTQILGASEKNMGRRFRINMFLGGFLHYTKRNPELRNNVWIGAFCSEDQRMLLSPNYKEHLDHQTLYTETIQSKAECKALSLTDRIIDNFINFYLHDDILAKVDGASMMNSLEVRSPFLDKTLAEFIAKLPANMKMKGLSRKYILKKAMYRRLPESIIKRSKKGFGIPVARWIKGPLKEILLETLSESRIKEGKHFDANFVSKIINEHLSGKYDHRKQIWTLLVFELWRQKYRL